MVSPLLNSNLTWKTLDISLVANNSAWSNVALTVNEAIGKHEVAIYDNQNLCWIYLKNITGDSSVLHTNGFGVEDAYSFVILAKYDFTNGTLTIITERDINSVTTPPTFTKFVYR